MIYNFNEKIGRTNSGIEFAQSYRAEAFRSIRVPFKMIYVEEYSKDNIAELAGSMGIQEEEIIWLYQFFTDCRISRSVYTLSELERTLSGRRYRKSANRNMVTYTFEGKGSFLRVLLTGEDSDRIIYVEITENGNAVRRDYYTYCRIFSCYYAGRDQDVRMVSRRYFNEDGSTAYEEILDSSDPDGRLYLFPDEVIYSKEALIARMFRKMNLTPEDIVLIDRNEKYGQVILESASPAAIGGVIHAEHFVESMTDSVNIKWNEYYEYLFAMQKHVDFFITATPAQKRKLETQMIRYRHVKPVVYAIPVGSLPAVRQRERMRKPYSMITASRLSSEKRLDVLISAAVMAHEQLPELTLDIYGKGALSQKLQEQIRAQGASAYIHLKGYRQLEDVYPDYEAYVSASSGEGFGLTLMEAAGEGLAFLGFHVRYGNLTFIRNEENGYLISEKSGMTREEKAQALSQGMIRMFSQADLPSFHEVSYEIAADYTIEKVGAKWKRLLQRIKKQQRQKSESTGGSCSWIPMIGRQRG